MRRSKQLIATACARARVGPALLRVQAKLRFPYLRALNYHDVPAREADAFARQLEFYQRHFVPVGYSDLLRLQRGEWLHDKPGLLLSFDDGLATHARVAAPILAKHGFPGWFMVPPGFSDTPAREQVAWARQHRIGFRDDPLPDGRIALSWSEIRVLAGDHVIGCHTLNHVRFSDRLTPQDFEHETVGAKARLEQELGAEVPVFAWVGGEEASYSRAGAEAIRRAGFAVSLMTNNSVVRPGADLLQIQRTNVESCDPPELVELLLSGLYDVFYARKRRRVLRATRTRP